jgi:hypothetical protein
MMALYNIDGTEGSEYAAARTLDPTCYTETAGSRGWNLASLPFPAPTKAPINTPTKAPISVPDVSATSASSCDDLGWTNAVNYGNSLVCGESDLGLGGCSGLESWTDARDFCEASGARLCSVVELEADETRATGCGYDKESVWASDACDATGSNGSNGRMSAAGASHLATEGSTACHADALTDTAASRPVRCCADVAVPSGAAVAISLAKFSSAALAPSGVAVAPPSLRGGARA